MITERQEKTLLAKGFKPFRGGFFKYYEFHGFNSSSMHRGERVALVSNCGKWRYLRLLKTQGWIPCWEFREQPAIADKIAFDGSKV